MKKPRHNLRTFVLAFFALPLFGTTLTSAQDSADIDGGECCSSAACCSDLWSRSQLTGDWLGFRPALADRGITFDADVTQFYEGVASGGLQQRFRYSGHGDYVLKFDFDKLSGQEGLFLQLRAEHRFGRALNLLDTGTFAAPAVRQICPR